MSPRWREGLLLAGFLLILGAAVVSVVLPELGKDAELEKPRPDAAR